LRQCLVYIDLNMVRAGVGDSPGTASGLWLRGNPAPESSLADP
jgi:hypothetical protein